MRKLRGGRPMTAVYWLIAFAVLAGIEAASMSLTTIWFAGGALVSFFFAIFFPEHIRLQLTAFVLVSFVLLILTRPMAKRMLGRRTIKTNAESLIGRKAKITVQVDNSKGTGTAMVGGQEWTARAWDENQVYEPDQLVWIREIQGVKLMVSDQQPGGVKEDLKA